MCASKLLGDAIERHNASLQPHAIQDLTAAYRAVLALEVRSDKHAKHITSQLNEMRQLCARLPDPQDHKEALDMLAEHEWVLEGTWRCPECGARKREKVHEKDCKLAAILRKHGRIL